MTIAERIKEEGLKQGLSLASIERKTHLANGSIAKWGKVKPSVEKLYKVASLLHVSIDYLYTGNNETTNLSQEENDWLNLYRQLSLSDPDTKNECIGFVKGYIAGNKK
ncbi:MAG: helix-turn-helix domain-containing protein [Clostridiales bacterium]|nr:helix-turn-helix domain-containing protein [Clostridiales bacterium]